MGTLGWLIFGVVVIALGLLYWFNRNTGLDVDQDGDVDLDDAKLAVKKTKVGVKTAAKETKRRARRVREELDDVTSAAKEVVNQAGDVVAAAKGKTRPGRKPKK